jgi:hypothetical protein
MVEEILNGKIPVTDRIIGLLLRENQKKLLINMIAIPRGTENKACRPKYFMRGEKKYSHGLRKAFGRSSTTVKGLDKDGAPSAPESGDKELDFNDIVDVALAQREKGQCVIDLMSLMKSEEAHRPAGGGSGGPMLNYVELYRTFVRQRKIKLIRYLFGQKMDFEFKVEIFIMTLDESAFDVAVLLYKEFAYLMRTNSNEDNRQIVSRLVSGMN